MFEVTLTGVEELLRTFEAAKARVHSLQYTIPREFENWRTEDMHSKYPKPLVTKKRRILRVSQRIYSRGRGSAAKHPRLEASAPRTDTPAARCCAPISTSS